MTPAPNGENVRFDQAENRSHYVREMGKLAEFRPPIEPALAVPVANAVLRSYLAKRAVPVWLGSAWGARMMPYLMQPHPGRQYRWGACRGHHGG